MFRSLFPGLLLTAAATTAMATPSALRCGKLVDVASGRVQTDWVVVFDHGVITGVGPAGSISLPAGVSPIDLSSATCLPGLIDVHTHLLDEPTDNGYEGLGISVPRATVIGVKNARITLRAGFTTVRNVNAPGFGDVAVRDGIEAGEIEGPRMLVSGPALGITGGHADNNLLPAEFAWKTTGIADGPWNARAKVRELVKYGVDVIKVMASGGVLSKGDQIGTAQYTPEELRAIVEEAHKLGRRVAAHAHGTQSIKDSIRAGVDSVEHASLIDDEGIALAKQRGTYLVFDIYNDDYIMSEGLKAGMLPESIDKERSLGLQQRENFRRAYHAGAKLAFGTDAGVYPHGDNARQFQEMVERDMKPLEAIRTATLNAADLLGLADKIGSLTPNHQADIVAVEGDPTVDVRVLEAMKFVMKGGLVFRDDFHSAPAANLGQHNNAAEPPAGPIAHEILNRELLTWDLEKRKDKAAYAALMAPEYLALTDRGVMDITANLREIDNMDVEDYAATDVVVRSIGRDTVLLTYNVAWKAAFGGKPLQEQDYAAAIWRKQDDRWVDAFYQETQMRSTSSADSVQAVRSDAGNAQVSPVAATGGSSSDPVVEAEKRSWKLAQARDQSAYAALLDEDFVAVSEYGRLNKTQNVQDLENLRIDNYSLSDVQVRYLGEDVAVVTYRITAKGTYHGERFESVNLTASAWSKRTGPWRNVFFQETPVR